MYLNYFELQQVLSGNLEGGACVVTSDVVLAAAGSPQFVQAPATFIHMSSMSGRPRIILTHVSVSPEIQCNIFLSTSFI